MANHLTPDELAKEMGIDRDEVIRICVEEGVPIYHGKIDKTLFQASLEAVGTASPPRADVAAEPEAARFSGAARGLRAASPSRVFAFARLLASAASPPSSRRRRSP